MANRYVNSCSQRLQWSRFTGSYTSLLGQHLMFGVGRYRSTGVVSPMVSAFAVLRFFPSFLGGKLSRRKKLKYQFHLIHALWLWCLVRDCIIAKGVGAGVQSWSFTEFTETWFFSLLLTGLPHQVEPVQWLGIELEHSSFTSDLKEKNNS